MVIPPILSLGPILCSVWWLCSLECYQCHPTVTSIVQYQWDYQKWPPWFDSRSKIYWTYGTRIRNTPINVVNQNTKHLILFKVIWSPQIMLLYMMLPPCHISSHQKDISFHNYQTFSGNKATPSCRLICYRTTFQLVDMLFFRLSIWILVFFWSFKNNHTFTRYASTNLETN